VDVSRAYQFGTREKRAESYLRSSEFSLHCNCYTRTTFFGSNRQRKRCFISRTVVKVQAESGLITSDCYLRTFALRRSVARCPVKPSRENVPGSGTCKRQIEGIHQQRSKQGPMSANNQKLKYILHTVSKAYLTNRTQTACSTAQKTPLTYRQTMCSNHIWTTNINTPITPSTIPKNWLAPFFAVPAVTTGPGGTVVGR